jgi:hypothetical protein
MYNTYIAYLLIRAYSLITLNKNTFSPSQGYMPGERVWGVALYYTYSESGSDPGSCLGAWEGPRDKYTSQGFTHTPPRGGLSAS